MALLADASAILVAVGLLAKGSGGWEPVIQSCVARHRLPTRAPGGPARRPRRAPLRLHIRSSLRAPPTAPWFLK